jgi:two-component sensor histidine kinase
MQGSRWTPLNVTLNYVVVGFLAAAVITIFLKLHDRDELYSWLALALTATSTANVISGVGGGRFTLGWDLGRVSWVISACVLFFYFMRQYARQQRLLARANELLEGRVAKRTAELRAANEELARSLEERSLLLREVYHRVKNNLQLVDSLLGFQSARQQDAAGKSGFEDVRRRVHALGLVHQQLMHSADLARVDTGSFLAELCANLGSATGAAERSIRITLSDMEPLQSSLDIAVPLGLLTTELVSHALKHGFTNGGSIAISLRRASPTTMVLTMVDTGTVTTAQRTRASTDIETRVVTGLVAQLRGELTTEDDGGARVTLRFPHAEART